MAKQKQLSRTARWNAAVILAKAAQQALSDSLGDLADIQSEFEEWRDNLPENLQGSMLGEKLDAVCDLDLDVLGEVESLLDECEQLDLPRGFGRD